MKSVLKSEISIGDRFVIRVACNKRDLSMSERGKVTRHCGTYFAIIGSNRGMTICLVARRDPGERYFSLINRVNDGVSVGQYRCEHQAVES